MKVRYPKLGEACTAFYNEPGPKVTIGVVSVTELRAPEGIGPDVKTRPRRGTLHIEFERRNTPRTCLPGLLFEWDQNMARDCKLFQPLDINFVEDSKGLFAEVECTMVLVSPSNLLGGRRLLDQTRVSISVPVRAHSSEPRPWPALPFPRPLRVLSMPTFSARSAGWCEGKAAVGARALALPILASEGVQHPDPDGPLGRGQMHRRSGGVRLRCAGGRGDDRGGRRE